MSYTTLITAYGRGGQWRKALNAFARMLQAQCFADHVVYETVVEVLWDTGGCSMPCFADHVVYGTVVEVLWDTASVVCRLWER